MTKRAESKHKIDRHLGVNLWGRPKSPINKREYRPGQHGQRRSKPSDFGVQLLAKQKLRGYYQEAMRRKGNNGEILIQLLERRLDAVIYRMKFAATVFAARQLVNHGHVTVNGKNVNIASYQVKDGDVIELRAKAKKMETVLVAAQLAERDVPDYMTVNHDEMK